MRNSRPPGSPRVRLISSLAMLTVVAGGVWTFSVRKTHDLLDLGVTDHIRCAMAGAWLHPTPDVTIVDGLSAALVPMPQAIANESPGIVLLSAHRCTLAGGAPGRAYVHVVLRRGEIPISVVLTPREQQDIYPRTFGSSTLHEARRDEYSVAGLQSGSWLVYIVSALPARENNEFASRVAPVIDRYTKN